MADFGVSRIAATYAGGQVSFSRFTATSAASVPVGAQVTSADGTQVFEVIADSTQSTYSGTAGAYIISAGVPSADVTVQAGSAGPGGNVGAGLVSILSTPISGIDFVTNVAAMVGGTSAESDSSLRARFQAFIGTRAQATPSAIGYAVSSTPNVASYTITQNQDYGYPYPSDPGSFYVVIDDGSGAPPGILVSAVAANVAAVAGCGIRSSAFAATTQSAVIAMVLTPAAGYVGAVVAPQVQNAVIVYVNGLPLGTTVLSIAGVSAVAVGVSGVGSIAAVTVNGVPSDLTLSAVMANRQVIRTSSVTVSY
jgi:hypothetical protein